MQAIDLFGSTNIPGVSGNWFNPAEPPVGILTLDVIDANTIDMDAVLTNGVRKQKRLSKLQF